MSLLLAAAREGLPLPGAVGLMSPRVEMEKRGDTLTTLTGKRVEGCDTRCELQILHMYCPVLYSS